jgi:hypothetical protein
VETRRGNEKRNRLLFQDKKIKPLYWIAEGLWRGSQIVKRSLMFPHVGRTISDILSLQPGILIQPADTGEYGEEEQTEHKVGRSTQKLIQFVTSIEEEE